MIGGAERIDVKSAVIGEHPQVIIAPPDHPLAKQRSISPREIAKQTILMREVGSGTRLLAERFLAQHGIEPRIGMEIGSNETIKQAVMAGRGIAFISAHNCGCAGLPEIRQWFVVHPATKRMMPAASSLRDFLVAEGHIFKGDEGWVAKDSCPHSETGSRIVSSVAPAATLSNSLRSPFDILIVHCAVFP
jgi:LysR family transcriptional regulator, low CO2-responsive transcriptional regulator